MSNEVFNEVFIDIETQSVVDIRTEGARAYVKDPSTRLMCIVAMIDDETHVWVPNCPYDISYDRDNNTPYWLTNAVASGRRFVAHNAYGFDAPAIERLLGLKPRWYDTVPACRASGLPGSLDAVGQALGIGGKDTDGKKTMLLLSKAKVRDGEYVYPVATPACWRRMVEYNIRDVELVKRIYEEVKGNEERDIVAVDREINERGVYVDQEWLGDLLAMWDAFESRGVDRLAELTRGALTHTNVASVPQVKRWLAMQGVHLETLNRKSIEALYDDPESFLGEHADAARIVEVLKLRQSLTRAMKGKLERIHRSLESDSRVRDLFVYWGAGPGRWTGRGLQIQNLARGVPIDVESIIEGPRSLAAIEAQCQGYDTDDALATLVRPCFAAPPGKTLGICDYNAVEARGVAWLAGEQWLLDAFMDPKRDVYCEFGSRIFGREITKADKDERFLAKTCVLGMGYGMSGTKFEKFADLSGIKLAERGLSGDGLVGLYRESSPSVVALWREVGNAAEAALRHGEGVAARGLISFRKHGGDHLYCVLPSGRMITYRHCKLVRKVPGYVKVLGLPPFEADCIEYRHPRGYIADLWGSKLVENIVQGLCADLLRASLREMKWVHLPVVIHVHDEIVCELDMDRQVNLMAELTSTPPAWAMGFPLRVEGFSCPRYVKSPWKGSVKADYLNGRSVL